MKVMTTMMMAAVQVVMLIHIYSTTSKKAYNQVGYAMTMSLQAQHVYQPAKLHITDGL
jgi:hypothetical protein